MSFSKSQIADALEEQMRIAIPELVAGNVTGIVKELTDAEDGTLAVSVGMKLSLSGNRVACALSLSYSRKFKDETEFITPDPDQPDLPIEDEGPVASSRRFKGSIRKGGGSVTIKVGGEA